MNFFADSHKTALTEGNAGLGAATCTCTAIVPFQTCSTCTVMLSFKHSGSSYLSLSTLNVEAHDSKFFTTLPAVSLSQPSIVSD